VVTINESELVKAFKPELEDTIQKQEIKDEPLTGLEICLEEESQFDILPLKSLQIPEPEPPQLDPDKENTISIQFNFQPNISRTSSRRYFNNPIEPPLPFQPNQPQSLPRWKKFSRRHPVWRWKNSNAIIKKRWDPGRSRIIELKLIVYNKRWRLNFQSKAKVNFKRHKKKKNLNLTMEVQKSHKPPQDQYFQKPFNRPKIKMKKLTKKKPWNFQHNPGRLKLKQDQRKLRPPPGHEDKLFKLKFYIKYKNANMNNLISFKKTKKKINKNKLTKEVWKFFKPFFTGAPGQETKLFNFYINILQKTKQKSFSSVFPSSFQFSHNHFFFQNFILINHKKHKKEKKILLI